MVGQWWSKLFIGFVISFVITSLWQKANYKDKKMVSLTRMQVPAKPTVGSRLGVVGSGLPATTAIKPSHFTSFIKNFIWKGIIFIFICSSLGICFNLSNTIYCDEDTDTETDTDNHISSILEYGDQISPLQALLNNEIAILLLILIHMVIILLVLFNKFYVLGSLNLISKLLAPAGKPAASNSWPAGKPAGLILVKFEKYKIMIDKLGNRFLNILLVINVVFILAYILLLLYINIKLSTNLDDFIDIHNDMKKGIILFINSKFLCLDDKHKNRWYNLNYYSARWVSSRLQ